MKPDTITYVIKQHILDVTNTTVVDSELIATVDSYEAAEFYLLKRDYTFNNVANKWYGKSLQYPIVIEKQVKKFNLFDIKSFV